MRLFLPLIAGAMLSACVSTPAPPAERRVTFKCDNGPDLTVVFVDGTARIVDAGGGEDIVLPQQPAGSGFSYGTPTRSIRGKGNEITYIVGRMAPMTCTAS